VPQERIFVVPNGIPDDDSIELEPMPPHNITRILFLSHMIVEKGVFVLLQAFKYLKEKNYSFEGIFAGDWSYNISENQFIKEVERLGLQDSVKWVGKVEGKEKLALLHGCDLLVFPTLFETFGNVVLEAMRSSLPVVATNEGSLPFIIEDGRTGLICKKNDPIDLSEKLQKMIQESEQRIEMGKIGRERYLRDFSFERFEENFSATLRKILEE
jgi:glycosyltransferase involved in cell wall biosynthesis